RGHPGPVDRPQTLLYPPVTLLDVARDDGDVAVVYDREVFEDRHVQARVVTPEEVGGAAYPLGAEAGPSPEGGARIERRAYYRDVRVRQVPRVRQAHEGAQVREARGLERVGWLVAEQWFFTSIRGSGGRLRLSPRLRLTDHLGRIPLRGSERLAQHVGHQHHAEAYEARYQQGTQAGDDGNPDEHRHDADYRQVRQPRIEPHL